MAEALLGDIDATADVFLLAHVGFEGWQEFFPLVSQGLQYVPRPARSVDDWPAVYAERLLLPLVPEQFSVEIELGTPQFLLQADQVDRD